MHRKFYKTGLQVTTLFLMGLMSLSLMGTTLAAGINPSCPSVYGATCPTGNISIDKKVQNPSTGEYMESISANVVTFSPGDEVKFRIEVKNTSTTDLSNIKVEDKLPDFIDFVSGQGQFNSSNKTLSWTIDNLKAGEFQLFFITGKIQKNKTLQDLGLTCLTNFAKAQQGQQVAQDNSIFCVQTKILGVAEELPKTGPENVVLIITASLGLFAMSAYFLNKSQAY